MKKDLESFMYQLRIKAQVEVIEMVRIYALEQQLLCKVLFSFRAQLF